MRYNNRYQADILVQFRKQFAKDVEITGYSIEVDGFNEPPVMQVCKLLDMMGPGKNGTDIFYDYQDLMARYAILGKMVKVFLGDEQIGAFQLNNLRDPWELVPMFAEHPKAYSALCDVVLSYLLKKFILPAKKANTPEVAPK